MGNALAAIFMLWATVAFASPVLGQEAVPPANFTIAFLGDQGLGPDSGTVLDLIRGDAADVHTGAGFVKGKRGKNARNITPNIGV